jgi:hypothetical protein
MSTFRDSLWPPTKTWRRSILWSVVFGFLVQLFLPAILVGLGGQRAAWFALLPGLLPILLATGGFFAGITWLGYVLMYTVNTIVYALLLFAGFRTCACLRRRYAKA